MTIPEEFRYFVGCFISHSEEWVDTEQEWIEFAASFSNPPQQLIIKRFIDETLNYLGAAAAPASGPSRDYANEFWKKISAALPLDPGKKINVHHDR
jgi:hypothetical protein